MLDKKPEGLSRELSEKQWLVRKAPTLNKPSYAILGPYLYAQVREMIEQGALGLEDELCPENSYWFSLHEIDEVRRYFGAGIVAPLDGEDATLPDLDIELEEPSDAHAEATINISRPARKPPVRKPIEISAKYRRLSATQLSIPSARLLMVEKSRFWMALLAVCSVMAIAAVLWVLRSLRV